MTASTARHQPPTPRRRPGPLGVLGWLVAGAARVVGRLGQALVAAAVLAGLLAALPWALWHFIGWPLPDHLPTPAEVQVVLLGPLSTPLLLDLLACLCWMTWAAFVIDVARCVLAAARGLRWPELPTGGPVRIVEGYHGCLAEGLDTEWIEAPREATRRDALDAVAALARALIQTEPQKTLDLLETARAFDPHNELLYRDIMRLQHRLGHLDAIPRTLSLLSTRLAEIEETPTPQALELAARLQRADTEHLIPGVPGQHDRRGEQRNTAAVH